MVIAIQYFFLLVARLVLCGCSFSINVARPARLAGRHLDDISPSHRLYYTVTRFQPANTDTRPCFPAEPVTRSSPQDQNEGLDVSLLTE